MTLFAISCFVGCNKPEPQADKPRPAAPEQVVEKKSRPEVVAEKQTAAKEPSEEEKLPKKSSEPIISDNETTTVFSEGVGTTQNEALKDAFRNAVQRVVGVVVDSETLVKNDAIISDKVLTFSDGAIKKYEELESSENKGLFRVKIKAAVEGRKVAARLEAAHISVKAVDVKNIAELFSKEVRADLDRLANEITAKEARENAKRILETDLSRIAKLNMIEAKVIGEIERGTKVGNKLPLKVKVRFEVNEAAFHEAMSKLEKSLLMNSSSWGKIAFLATPDLIMKRENQGSINEDIGESNVILVNKNLASEKWRSIWHYYILPAHAGELFYKRLVSERKPVNVKLSLLDKDGDVFATDEFKLDTSVTTFRWNESKAQKPAYSNRPFNSNRSINQHCYFASPFFFSFQPDIRYMLGFEQVRDISLTLEEINLIKSVKCELFP